MQTGQYGQPPQDPRGYPPYPAPPDPNANISTSTNQNPHYGGLPNPSYNSALPPPNMANPNPNYGSRHSSQSSSPTSAGPTPHWPQTGQASPVYTGPPIPPPPIIGGLNQQHGQQQQQQQQQQPQALPTRMSNPSIDAQPSPYGRTSNPNVEVQPSPYGRTSNPNIEVQPPLHSRTSNPNIEVQPSPYGYPQNPYGNVPNPSGPPAGPPTGFPTGQAAGPPPPPMGSMAGGPTSAAHPPAPNPAATQANSMPAPEGSRNAYPPQFGYPPQYPPSGGTQMPNSLPPRGGGGGAVPACLRTPASAALIQPPVPAGGGYMTPPMPMGPQGAGGYSSPQGYSPNSQSPQNPAFGSFGIPASPSIMQPPAQPGPKQMRHTTPQAAHFAQPPPEEQITYQVCVPQGSLCDSEFLIFPCAKEHLSDSCFHLYPLTLSSCHESYFCCTFCRQDCPCCQCRFSRCDRD